MRMILVGMILVGTLMAFKPVIICTTRARSCRRGM